MRDFLQALVLEAMWQTWIECWSPAMRTMLETNGTRGRWLALCSANLDAVADALMVQK